MARLARDEFEVLVGEALDELPPELMKAISNVQVVVQDLPGPESAGAHVAPHAILLGLYTGITHGQHLAVHVVGNGGAEHRQHGGADVDQARILVLHKSVAEEDSGH